MEPLSISTEGIAEAESMLLSMILSFASDQLSRSWQVRAGSDVQAVIYDLANPRARLAWEQRRSLTHPISVLLSDKPTSDSQWVMPKPIRTHTVIPFLNKLSIWLEQQAPQTLTTPLSGAPRIDPFSDLKVRLTTVASQRLSQSGNLKEIKLIIAGSVAAGKTTAIKSISDIEPIRTDVAASDHVAQLKDLTTTAMDYGETSLPNGQKLRIYGTPGQRRYDFMSTILCRGALGLVLLIDNRSEDPLAEFEYYSYVFANLIHESAMVIGVTHRDESPEPSLDQYVRYLQQSQRPWPVFTIDPRNKSDVVTLLDALITMLEHARKPHTVGSGRA